MSQLSTIIEQAFEDRANFTAADCPAEIRAAVEEVIAGLDNGTLARLRQHRVVAWK